MEVFSWGGAVFALAVVLAAGIVRGFSGFGAGLVMVPSLSLLLGPEWAVPIVVLIEAVAAAQLVPTALGHAKWRSIASLGVAACLTIPLGGFVLASLEAQTMRRAISIVVIVFALVLWTGWRYRAQPGLPVTLGTGATSGLLTGAAGIGGPPVILFYLAGPGAAPATRASLIGYFAITQAFALASYVAFGLLDRPVLLWAGGLLPGFLLGAWGGTRLFGRVNDVWFRRATLLFLIVVSLIGLFRGAGDAR